MPVPAAALEPLLRLALVPGVGPGRLTALVRHFGSADGVLGASALDLSRVPRCGREMVRRLQTAATPGARDRALAAVRGLERAGGFALAWDDPDYPPGFRQLADPPFLVFASGRVELLHSPAFAVVGTREPTPYGRAAAGHLAAELARAGLVVVSGMARGIDAAAHLGALEAGGGTVGVLGNGIDQVYPVENRALHQRVRESGALVTEFPPGERPRPGNFPRRNRLIAALSRGVLVVEMGERSGALHTVNYALEQGKDVFAVPGPIGTPASSGTNQLLKEGARLVTSVGDILDELGGVEPRAPAATVPQPGPSAVPDGLAADDVRVLDVLASKPLHIDAIAASSRLPTQVVLSSLLTLELLGAAESLPGKHFRRV